MSVRAKFILESVIPVNWGGAQAIFRCSYDDTIPEDQKFCKATPSGEIRMQIDNPAALQQLTIGKSYYVDFTEVPPPVQS